MVPPLCQESLPRPFTLEKVRGSTTATDSVSIPFRSGRRSHPGEHGMRLGTLRSVSIPFRSGRRSHDDCTQPGDGLHECQSPSDRGAVHTPVLRAAQGGHLLLSIPFRSGRRSHLRTPLRRHHLPRVSIPFRSGRRSHGPAGGRGALAVLRVSVPFRSGRRSHGLPGPDNPAEACVNPLQIGAPFTPSTAMAVHTCQAGFSRGSPRGCQSLQIGAPFTHQHLDG